MKNRFILLAFVLLAATPGCLASNPDATPEVMMTTLPGTDPYEESLIETLKAALRSKSGDYEPRTRHLNPDGTAKYTNRLFLESSPYLQQHAHNPVNWYPWGDEAFEVARKLGRPILLSIGYSTCHWCHVMEEESFEDEEIAAYLNAHYVTIKVDREERPDVDSIYMAAVQALTGRGGWPMTVWLTHDRKPFYGGTYFPARDGDRGASIGFLTLVTRIHDEIWQQQPERVAQSAESLAGAIRDRLTPVASGAEPRGAEALHNTVRMFAGAFDRVHGGAGGAPKFPSNLPIRLLLRYHRRTGDARALEMATRTLEKMAGGGMYDHVGGGFHRYSVDAQWLVPHFEKMLYDNAQLATVYLEGYLASGREDFARVAREILRYVERDMRSPEGAFYSATDADSLVPGGHREEGWFFTWTPAELAETLGERRAKLVTAYYAVTPAGNFEGRNILNTPLPLAQVARRLEMSEAEARAIVEESRELLYAARGARPAPLRDEKILAGWNGLMIGAYAQGALTLGDPRYARIASEAADFVLTRMRRDGRLLRSYKDGQARHNAYLVDYAFMIAGLLDLYEATGELRWLEESIALDRVLHDHYEDPGNGGYFMTSGDHEALLAREKPNTDGAVPSGNSVQVLNLLRLRELTSNDAYRLRADRTLQAFGGQLNRAPAALSEMLLAVDFQLDRAKEIVIVTPEPGRQAAEPFLAELRTRFVPNRVLTVVAQGDELQRHAAVVPLVQGKVARDGETTAYVCESGICKLPTRDPKTFAGQIAAVLELDADPGASGSQ